MPAANGGAVSHPETCRVPKIEERIANADLHRLMPCPWIRRSPDAGRGGQLLDKKVLTLEAARKIVTLTQRAWREDFAVVDWGGNPVAGGDLPGEIVGQAELAWDPI
jgi:hypothetical protein